MSVYHDASRFRLVLDEVRRFHTRKQVAEATGVSVWTLRQIETGTVTKIRTVTALALMEHLPRMLDEPAR